MLGNMRDDIKSTRQYSIKKFILFISQLLNEV